MAGTEMNRLACIINKIFDTLQAMISKIISFTNDVKVNTSDVVTNAKLSNQSIIEIAQAITTVSSGASQQNEKIMLVNEHLTKMREQINSNDVSISNNSEAVQSSVSLMDEITSAIENIAKEASILNGSSVQMVETSENGRVTVDGVLKSIDSVSKTINQIAEEITSLGEQSGKIDKIITVIDEIAAQTNLLALNAAIEAARAGEHGKGFAVVADEVRKLAERSMEATKEISILVEGIQKKTNLTVNSMQHGTEEVGKVLSMSNDAKEALKQINEAIKKSTDQIQNISASTEQVNASTVEVSSTTKQISIFMQQTKKDSQLIKKGSTDIFESISIVADVSTSNLAVAEEVAATAETMSGISYEIANAANELLSKVEQLREQANFFKV